jgi:hypothetical protein
MNTTVFTLPKRCRIGTVTIRETFGADEAEAIIASENNASDPKDELVGLSIVAVNGEVVLPGNSGYDTWPTKTRQVVSRFYDSINDIVGRELLPLIEEAEENGTELVDGSIQTRYPFPPKAGLEFVVLRELMEEDERAASVAGKKASETMISRCVVRTNLGDGLPLEDLAKLNTRTRNILTSYWAGMNFVPEDELLPLIKAAEAVKAAATVPVEAPAGPSVATSSPSGSGSPAPADAV